MPCCIDISSTFLKSLTCICPCRFVSVCGILNMSFHKAVATFLFFDEMAIVGSKSWFLLLLNEVPIHLGSSSVN